MSLRQTRASTRTSTTKSQNEFSENNTSNEADGTITGEREDKSPNKKKPLTTKRKRNTKKVVNKLRKVKKSKLNSEEVATPKEITSTITSNIIVINDADEDVCPCCGVQKDRAHKNTYKCDECPKKFKFFPSLEKHRDEFHCLLPGAIKCPHCPANCKDGDLYEKHIADHTSNNKMFSCPGKCGVTFTRKFDIKRHLKIKGCDGSSVEELNCNVCSAKFNRRDNLLDHIRGHILGKKKQFKCKLCLKTFRRNMDLNLHYSKEHDGEKDKFQCDICKKWYFSKGYLANHIKLHNGKRPYRCGECGFYFRTKAVLRRHELIHSDVKPYNCELCSATFIQRTQLEWHLHWHTGDMTYKCDKCQIGFPVSTKLKSHMLYVHDGVPKLKCWYPNCSKEFTDRYTQKLHMLTHSQNGAYTCTICDKKFSSSNSYRVHNRTHLMERTRRCPLCVPGFRSAGGGRAYTRADLLLRHVRDKHSDFFTSTICSMRELRGPPPAKIPKASPPELQKMTEIIDHLIEGQELDFGLNQVGRINPMNIRDLTTNVEKLLCNLIDTELLRDVGWPKLPVDQILENVVKSIEMVPASPQLPLEVRLRENTVTMLKGCVEDKTLTNLLDTHLVDVTIRRMLTLYQNEDLNEF